MASVTNGAPIRVRSKTSVPLLRTLGRSHPLLARSQEGASGHGVIQAWYYTRWIEAIRNISITDALEGAGNSCPLSLDGSPSSKMLPLPLLHDHDPVEFAFCPQQQRRRRPGTVGVPVSIVEWFVA